MDNKYQIFADTYHNLLELVEKVDDEVCLYYKKVVEKLQHEKQCAISHSLCAKSHIQHKKFFHIFAHIWKNKVKFLS